jgi:3-hydroxybutyryl-CoA dehydratase
MGAAVGMYFRGTAIAYLEHRARFLAPVRAGEAVAEAQAWILVSRRPR